MDTESNPKQEGKNFKWDEGLFKSDSKSINRNVAIIGSVAVFIAVWVSLYGSSFIDCLLPKGLGSFFSCLIQ